MNKLFFIGLIMCLNIYGADFFWDLGVGITNIPLKKYNNDINISTYHRLEGLKKYYSMDYDQAVYHFSQLEKRERASIMYEFLDCYYSMGKLYEANQVLENYHKLDLSENIIYLKSKIYLKLNMYNQALSDLNYLISVYPDSDYADILQFEIEKINLKINE